MIRPRSSAWRPPEVWVNVKGVIVAAGFGSRLLPVTRVVPKELLPLVDRPAIDWIAEEFEQAGIEDVLLITSRRKRALEDWFDRDPELEAALGATRVAPRRLRVHSVRQARMGGTGDALRLVAAFAGSDAVVVAYPDDLFPGSSAAAELVEVWKATGCSVLAAADLPHEDVSRYGVIDAVSQGSTLRVRSIVEKPAPGTEPSTLISLGRYLYTPDFFPLLEAQFREHKGGEYYPMPAMNELAGAGRLMAHVVRSPRLDTGTALGYAQAFVDQALQRPDLGPEFASWLRQRLDQSSATR